MADYINIGAVPADEECAQIGEEGYEIRAKRECKMFIDLIRKTLGPEPVGAQLKVRGFQHDFGRYYEVICTYKDQESFDYALTVESDSPTRWEPNEVTQTSMTEKMKSVDNVTQLMEELNK